MPIRREAARVITEAFTGTVWFSHGQCQTMPHDQYEQARVAGDALYELVIDHIDWPRVLIEATSRHLNLVDAGRHPARAPGWRGLQTGPDQPCAGCIREALLADERVSDWVSGDQQAESPRRRRTLGVFARHLVDAFSYRRDTGTPEGTTR